MSSNSSPDLSDTLHSQSGLNSLIKENDRVILWDNNNLKSQTIISDRQIWMNKVKICLKGAIGQHYGSVFKVQNTGVLQKIPSIITKYDDPYFRGNDCLEIVSKDNRNLIDQKSNQNLTREEIIKLRGNGLDGSQIVDKLVENSATFCSKTEFSQHKYINKKKRKHEHTLTILRPCTRLVARMMHSKGPARQLNLRVDTLGLILAQSNIRAGTEALVVESCGGLVIAAFLERMGGHGKLVHFYHGSQAARPAVNAFNFTDKELSPLLSYPLHQMHLLRENEFKQLLGPTTDKNVNCIQESNFVNNSHNTKQNNSLCIPNNKQTSIPLVTGNTTVTVDNVNLPTDSTNLSADGLNVHIEVEELNLDSTQSSKEIKSKPVKLERELRNAEHKHQISRVRDIIVSQQWDVLVVSVKFCPTPIVLGLLDFVLPSRPLVVFCQHREPLVDCYTELRQDGRVIQLQIQDTFFRKQQVLNERTHPEINMNSSGGYVLTGIVVKPSNS